MVLGYGFGQVTSSVRPMLSEKNRLPPSSASSVTAMSCWRTVTKRVGGGLMGQAEGNVQQCVGRGLFD
jgi:hypothetical protein